MSLMPSPVLIIGDSKLGKDTVVIAKKKYAESHWVTVSASKQTPDEIRMISSIQQIGISKKVVLITELPNKKLIRDFIADLVKSSNDYLRFVIWDSTNAIKIDPKKGINKTWQEWINGLKTNKGFLLVNNGGDFAENDTSSSTRYVQELFEKRKRTIDLIPAKILVDLVGRKRSMLSSEVAKLCLTAPREVTFEFILDNAFPSSKDAVLYKFGNDLDKNYRSAVSSLELFLDMGINANVLAQVLVSKARWHLAICHLYSQGRDWNSVRNEVLGMGKFPSCIWHNEKIPSLRKKGMSIELNDPEKFEEFMILKLGIPEGYVDITHPKTISKAVKRGEIIPMPFMADMMISYIKGSLVAPNGSKYTNADLRSRLLNRAVNVYLSIADDLKEIRYEVDNQTECLHNMVRTWSNNSL
jgi:hypothetical protein